MLHLSPSPSLWPSGSDCSAIRSRPGDDLGLGLGGRADLNVDALQRVFERGYALSLRQKTRSQGQKLLLLAAANGHVAACVRAGFLLSEREGRTRLWLYAAASHGDTEALLLLGHLLGRVPKSKAASIEGS
jgi:TPR repeat protein